MAAVSSTVHAEPIRIAGSDLLAPALCDVIEESARAEGWEVEFDLHGSYLATREVSQGGASAALVLRDPTVARAEAEEGNKLEHVIIGHLVALVVVAESNPLDSITLSGLARLFGANAVDRVSRWGDVGDLGESRMRNVAPAVVNETGDIAIGLFQSRALQGAALGRQVERLENPAQLVERVLGNRDTIGIVGTGFTDPRARLLAVAAAQDEPAVAPSPDAIAAGDYPLALPLELVFPAGAAESVRALARVLLASDATRALEVSGFRPLPPEARERVLASFPAR
ncbi:MAG: PstS family phosphate ABC transporter substrate-binding protein [Opitutaceae bacterium]